MAISSIFAPAHTSGQIPHNPVSAVKLPKVVSGEPTTVTASQLAALLEAAPERSRAAIAIQALSGLRLSEVQRLDWGQVSLTHRLITVGADRTKTASRRHVPVCDSLLAWITPLHRGQGMVAESEDILRNDSEKARREAGIKVWPANAMRHTCASAWCSLEHDVSKVAAWLGNSPTIIHQNYRALLTHEQASAWFAVRPTSSSTGTVLPFSVAG